MSAPKLVRAAQTAVFNQFMTREAISSATFRPAEQKIAEQPKLNIRLHDESTHLKFGFPKSEKQVSIPNNDDYIQLNAKKLIKEEEARQSAFSKLTALRF